MYLRECLTIVSVCILCVCIVQCVGEVGWWWVAGYTTGVNQERRETNSLSVWFLNWAQLMQDDANDTKVGVSLTECLFIWILSGFYLSSGCECMSCCSFSRKWITGHIDCQPSQKPNLTPKNRQIYTRISKTVKPVTKQTLKKEKKSKPHRI